MSLQYSQHSMSQLWAFRGVMLQLICPIHIFLHVVCECDFFSPQKQLDFSTFIIYCSAVLYSKISPGHVPFIIVPVQYLQDSIAHKSNISLGNIGVNTPFSLGFTADKIILF